MSGKSLITEPLGLFGWKHLEPVILASLITEMPMLLVGKHGSAKSFILERLAESLGMEYRFYNASLINYDDLVGIPVPVNNNTALDYISNPNSIWDAEVVFIDELNRTRPELQNKIFPIIHDKRVQGTDLKKLKYRWAAMNPPAQDDDDDDLGSPNYLGAMPLDPALADRFPFIIPVPSWDELTPEDQERILADEYLGRHEIPVDINQLISEGKEELKRIIATCQVRARRYVVALMSLLEKKYSYLSTRRAGMFLETLLAIHAAKLVLNRYGAELNAELRDSCLLQVQNTIPMTAVGKVSPTDLIMIADQAVKTSGMGEGIEKSILLERSPLERVILAIQNQSEISAETLSDVVTSSLSSLGIYQRRAVALICYLQLRTRTDIPAAVMETIVNEIRDVLRDRDQTEMVYLRTKRIADRVQKEIQDDDSRDKTYRNYLNNLLSSFLPSGYGDEDDVKGLHSFFRDIWGRIYGS